MKQATRTIAILAVSALVGCAGQMQPVTPPDATPMVLRVHSTTATAPLLATFEEAYSQVQPRIVIDGQSANHAALVTQLQAGQIDYFLSHHYPDDPTLWVAPLAQDALTLITAPTNPTASITTDQLRRLYRGYTRNWADVSGGTHTADVTLYSRENGSAIRTEFERLVMGQETISPNTQVLTTNSAILMRVADQTGAIGYMPLSQLNQRVRVLAVDGVRPSRETILDLQYSLRMTIYVIGQAEPQRDYRAFIGWMQGGAGQAAIPASYAPLPR